MTPNKPGQNLRENTPTTKDGPEEYTEDLSVGGSEDESIEALHTDSADTSSASKAENFRKPGIVTVPNLPRTVKRSLRLKPSRFGSPFAYAAYQNRHDFFKGLLTKSTRDLFDQVVVETSTLRERLSPGVALTDDGSDGQFCVLKKCEPSSTESNSGEGSNSNDTQLRLYGFEPNKDKLKLDLNVLVRSTSSSDASSTTSGNGKDDKVIDVCRRRNPKSGEFEYFVLGIGLDYLSINGIDVDPTESAGPLPDFAVFELGTSSIFWWRTAAALGYMPSLKRKRDSEDKDEDSAKKALKSDTDPSSNSQVFLESKNWLVEYRRRIRLCEEKPIKYTSAITDLHPPHQLPNGKLRNIDVILAIGAVWCGLIAKVDFAYADSALFSLARCMRMVGMYAVNGGNHFIMPLLFNEELPTLPPESEDDTAEPLEPVFSAFQRANRSWRQKNPSLLHEDEEVQSPEQKGGVGHFVLAIAEKVNRDSLSIVKDFRAKETLVRLRFMDSAKETIDKTTIRRVARNTVRHSGWLGDTWPCFDGSEEHWTEVPRQSGDRCGEHTVMNAWAYMLDIQLASTRERGLGASFYKEVRKMILLALRGQLDSLTIRAWMQHSKYAVDAPISQFQQTQIQKPHPPNPLRNMQTVALNEDVFDEILKRLHEQEQRRKSYWGTIFVPPNGATAQQLGFASTVATGTMLSHTGQDPVAGPSGISSISSVSSSSGSSTSSANIPPVPPKDWQESLEQRLAYHRALKARNPRTTEDRMKVPSHIESSSEMADDEVVLAIASIWEGLKRLGLAKYDFAYAGMDIFGPGGEQQTIGAVGGRSRFIMPLLLSHIRPEALANQGQGKSKIDEVGHFVLCVAELVSDDPLTVQITVFNSMLRSRYGGKIVGAVLTAIDLSGWPGVAVDRSQFRRFSKVAVPRQVGSNTCGLHVIFNAWATMLDIPIHQGHLRRGQTGEIEDEDEDEIFLQEGLEIVNLALAGFMDSATIQAFFNAHGYSVEQHFGDPAHAVIPVSAVGMNHEKFRRTLLKRHRSEEFAHARAQRIIFPHADMAELMELGMSEEQAWRALLISGGNREGAAEWCLNPEPPEEALSPKTPDRG